MLSSRIHARRAARRAAHAVHAQENGVFVDSYPFHRQI